MRSIEDDHMPLVSDDLHHIYLNSTPRSSSKQIAYTLLPKASTTTLLEFTRIYSIEELKDACRRFPVQGWESWCEEPKQLFLRWMLNEMSAFLSFARGDAPKPMCGIAEGFADWKSEQGRSKASPQTSHNLRKRTSE